MVFRAKPLILYARGEHWSGTASLLVAHLSLASCLMQALVICPGILLPKTPL